MAPQMRPQCRLSKYWAHIGHFRVISFAASTFSMVAFRGIRMTAAISDPRARQEVPSGTASKRQVLGKPNPKPQVQSGLALKQHMPNRTDSKHQVPSGPLSIDRELGHGLVVSVGYLFVSAHKLVRAENLNVCPQAGTTNSATSCPAAGPPPPDCHQGKPISVERSIPIPVCSITPKTAETVSTMAGWCGLRGTSGNTCASMPTIRIRKRWMTVRSQPL